jgi:hypothetical protein
MQKLEHTVNNMQGSLTTTNAEVYKLKQLLETLHRAHTCRQIVIENAPLTNNENNDYLCPVIIKLLAAIGVPNTVSLSDAYRLGKRDPNKPRPPPILVEFPSNTTRDGVMSVWRNKKTTLSNEICPLNLNIGLSDQQNMYINKNHTPSIRDLLGEARKLKKYVYKVIFEYANSVYVKRIVNDEPIKVINSELIQQIITHAQETQMH